jgi:hypothetical protein
VYSPKCPVQLRRGGGPGGGGGGRAGGRRGGGGGGRGAGGGGATPSISGPYLQKKDTVASDDGGRSGVASDELAPDDNDAARSAQDVGDVEVDGVTAAVVAAAVAAPRTPQSAVPLELRDRIADMMRLELGGGWKGSSIACKRSSRSGDVARKGVTEWTDLHVSFHALPQTGGGGGDPPPAAPLALANEVTVRVVRGSNMANSKGKRGVTDPAVSLFLGEETLKSAAVKGTHADPQWGDEHFRFQVENWHHLTERCLKLVVKAKEPFGNLLATEVDVGQVCVCLCLLSERSRFAFLPLPRLD